MRPGSRHPQPAGDPQQPAHGLAQIDRGPVGELEHHGRLAAADALEQRLAVVDQQDCRPVGWHVVHERRDRRRSGADQCGVAPAQRQAAGALGVGGCGRTPKPRASHGNPLYLGEGAKL